jgi:molecular chaperone GrpE
MTNQEDKVEISFLPNDEEEDEVKEEKKKHSSASKSTKKRPSIKKLQHTIEEQQEQVEAAHKERDEFKDKYLRTLAEMDNFRKRVKKEKEDYQKYVLSEFLLDLLQVYDNLERALKAKTPAQKKDSVLTLLVSDDEKSILSGVEMIHKQFSDLLRKNKVEEIIALDKPFDPNIHQALSKEETEEVEEPTVMEVYQKGFLYNGKLLRPALTKVAVPKEEVEEEDTAEDSNEEQTEE